MDVPFLPESDLRQEFGWGNKAENLIWWHGPSHWEKPLQTLKVCWPRLSTLLYQTSFPLYALDQADTLQRIPTHAHTSLHIHKVISWVLSMTLTSLQSLLASFAEEVTSFCLKEYRVSHLFGRPHASDTSVQPSFQHPPLPHFSFGWFCKYCNELDTICSGAKNA